MTESFYYVINAPYFWQTMGLLSSSAIFIGSIVYIEKGIYRVSSVPQLQVIDGQQRLTTVVLFLNAIRKEMERFESLRTLASGLQETFVVTRDLNDQPIPKLTLNRDTRAFFYDTILEQSENIQGPKVRSHHFLLKQRTTSLHTWVESAR